MPKTPRRPARRAPLLILTLALLALAPGTARGGLMPFSVTVTPEAGDNRWGYEVVVQSNSTVKDGDYFTIYDFAGFVPASNLQPEGFTFVASLLGPTPDLTLPIDSPDVLNLTWTYNGPDSQIGQVTLGVFSALSEYPNPMTGFFTATSRRTNDGVIDNNITYTDVPVPTQVPEPGTLALLGLGVPALVLARRRRRASA